jgi:hypothetical protein
MSAGPSIADLLEQSHRELAGTDARVYRRVADHLQRSSEALHDLQDPQARSTASRGTPSCKKPLWPSFWNAMA